MDLAANLESIQRRIQSAATRANREPSTVVLLAVAKGQGPAAIRAASDLGLTLFGENRVQEAKIKIGQCPGKLHWHLIGHLQSNKCRDAVHFFESIQSVDSLSLAQEINKWSEKSAKSMPILLEVNVAGEASKFGFKPAQLLADLAAINRLPRIEIHGLMTIAPWSPEPEKVRPFFRQLRELKTQCEQLLGAPLPQLSMGMSADFEVAIEEGATLVRIGTALFGARTLARPAA
jgi:pyridoxal phosphate enzyme (YggS family)